VVVPVLEALAELAIGEGFVADPEGVGLVGLAGGGEVLAGERQRDAGGEVVLMAVGGGVVRLDVAEEPGAEGLGNLGREGEDAGPLGDDGDEG
jgi:hypothetical protein